MLTSEQLDELPEGVQPLWGDGNLALLCGLVASALAQLDVGTFDVAILHDRFGAATNGIRITRDSGTYLLTLQPEDDTNA